MRAADLPCKDVAKLTGRITHLIRPVRSIPRRRVEGAVFDAVGAAISLTDPIEALLANKGICNYLNLGSLNCLDQEVVNRYTSA